MVRPKKEKNLQHKHQIMLRLTDTQYEIISTNAKTQIFHWRNMPESSL